MYGSVLKIEERLQAGDTMLLRFSCPECNSDLLVGYPILELPCCGLDCESMTISIKHARLLSGTRRMGRISKKNVQKLICIQGLICAYCSESLEYQRYHVEHILPVCVGGTNDLKNLCLSCPPCNLTAGSKIFPSVAAKSVYIKNQRGFKSNMEGD